MLPQGLWERHCRVTRIWAGSPGIPKGTASSSLTTHLRLVAVGGGGLLKVELFDVDSELLLDSSRLGTGTHTSS